MCVHTGSRNIPLYGIGFFWWLKNVNDTEKGHGDNLLDTAITTKNGGRNVIFQTAVRLLYFVLEREYTAAETTVFLLAVGRYMDSG